MKELLVVGLPIIWAVVGCSKTTERTTSDKEGSARPGEKAGSRAVDPRPAETRPADPRPAETRPAEPRPAETRPAEPRTIGPASARRGAKIMDGFFVGMTKKQVRAHRGFPAETEKECAEWCSSHGSCCSLELVRKYYSLRPKDPEAVYLRGKVAGLPVRVTVTFFPKGDLRMLDVVFTTYRADKPLIETPIGAHASKLFGKPTSTHNAGKYLRFSTGFGTVVLLKRSRHTPCRCPKGAKCDCHSMSYIEYSMRIIVKISSVP